MKATKLVSARHLFLRFPPSSAIICREFHPFIKSNYYSSGPTNPFPGSQSGPSTSADFNQSTVCEALSSYNNDYQRALEFFNWVESNCEFQHNTETYNRMLDILGKFFEFDKSWELIQSMRKNWFSMPNYATFRILFKRYVCAHMVQEAIDTFDKLGEFNMKDEISFCNLLDALCEYKHVIEAEQLWLERRGYFRSASQTKVYNMLLRGWLKIGWWSKCREFWEEMEKKGVRKDLVSYSIYMDIQRKSGKPWKAVKLYKEMKRRRIQLDVVAYNTVVHAVGSSEGVDFSIRLYKEMVELGCQPNVATYNTIIKLLCENMRMNEAYNMLNQMVKKGCQPNTITYNCFFRYLVNPTKILKLFESMIQSGLRPGGDTYVMLMRKFGTWGFLRPVFIVWNKMEELGCSPDAAAYNALIDALVQKGMLDEAKRYDEEMLAKGLSPKPRVELETEVISGGQSGDVVHL